MKTFVLELLECPDCHGRLDWNIQVEAENEIEEAAARCSDCDAVYLIRDGIGVFLTADLPRNDMWADVDSVLAIHLRDHPDDEKLLIKGPAEDLSPTDQIFRALILDERGEFAEASKIEELANKNLYTPEFMDCWRNQTDHVVESVASLDGPIVDLACGRCYLVEKIVARLRRPVIATDFSLAVLRRDRRYFEFLGLGEFVSFLAFDARRTPFRNDVVGTLTTNLGLPNIEDPGDLASELNRIVDGVLLAISHFIPEDDEANAKVIEEAGVAAFVYHDSALRYLRNAGWDAVIENKCSSPALPSPESNIFEGARAEAIPVAPTEFHWGTIQASNSVGSAMAG